MLHVIVAFIVFFNIKKDPIVKKDDGMVTLDIAELSEVTKAPKLGKPKPKTVSNKKNKKKPVKKKKEKPKKIPKKVEKNNEKISKKPIIKTPKKVEKNNKKSKTKKENKKKTINKKVVDKKNDKKVNKTKKVEKKTVKKKAVKNLKKKKEDPFEKLIKEKSKVKINGKGKGGHMAKSLGPKVTASEIAALRERISQCWIYQAGLKGGENIIVKVDMTLAPDAMVTNAKIVDEEKMKSDPYYRAAAESAIRAVRDPKCQPFPLPKHKYKTWKRIILSFNPKMMH